MKYRFYFNRRCVYSCGCVVYCIIEIFRVSVISRKDIVTSYVSYVKLVHNKIDIVIKWPILRRLFRCLNQQVQEMCLFILQPNSNSIIALIKFTNCQQGLVVQLTYS